MKKTTKWTQEMRRYVYTTLRDRFGKYSTWENKTNPGNGQTKFYDEVLQQIADKLNEFYLPKGKKPISMMAIRQQVNWAIQRQEKITSREFYMIMMCNTVAAYEVSFMETSDLAELHVNSGVKNELH